MLVVDDAVLEFVVALAKGLALVSNGESRLRRWKLHMPGRSYVAVLNFLWYSLSGELGACLKADLVMRFEDWKQKACKQIVNGSVRIRLSLLQLLNETFGFRSRCCPFIQWHA